MISNTVPCVNDKDDVHVVSGVHKMPLAGACARGGLRHTDMRQNTDLVACHDLHSDALQGGCSRFAYGTCVGTYLVARILGLSGYGLPLAMCHKNTQTILSKPICDATCTVALSSPASAPARNRLTSAGQPIICWRRFFLTSDPRAAKQLCCHCVLWRAAAVVEQQCTTLLRLLPFARTHNGLISLQVLGSDVL